MKNLFLILTLIISANLSFGQETFNLYNPDADAAQDIAMAVSKAKAENKHVFIQIGGNWCGWCKLFHELVTSDEDIHSFMTENYETIHINYSKENKNLDVLASLDYPQRFGFPVFVILDQNGKRIHTQNSGYLEEGKGHSKKVVLEFLKQWSPEALNPENYKN